MYHHFRKKHNGYLQQSGLQLNQIAKVYQK